MHPNFVRKCRLNINVLAYLKIFEVLFSGIRSFLTLSPWEHVILACPIKGKRIFMRSFIRHSKKGKLIVQSLQELIGGKREIISVCGSGGPFELQTSAASRTYSESWSSFSIYECFYTQFSLCFHVEGFKCMKEIILYWDF